jgi:hypothetical protein
MKIARLAGSVTLSGPARERSTLLTYAVYRSIHRKIAHDPKLRIKIAMKTIAHIPTTPSRVVSGTGSGTGRS